MRMYRMPLLAAACIGAASMTAAGVADLIADPGSSGGHGPYRYRRGKRAQAKAKKRPNMRHVSKRVRRKHRRAA